MLDFLYTLIIFPLVQIMEMCFVAIYRIFKSRVISLAGISVIVTLLTTPLYLIAEKWQNAERAIQKKLRPKIGRIKAVFSGDEQYMILSVYYRQNHYHPVYTLRNTFGLLVQIPFFIAAYNYLSSLELLKDSSFLFISSLGSPDRLLSIGGFGINILPIAMTLINCISGAVYSKGFFLRDKIQIYATAAIFLVLLYNSPSGLVLYWTINNIFSLLKNILIKTGYTLQIIYFLLCLCVIALYIYFIPLGFSPKRLFVVGLCSLVFFAPLFKKLYIKIKNFFDAKITRSLCAASFDSTFIISSFILFILAGAVIPGALISSSVQEFSFIENYTTPLPFVFRVLFQSAGFFLFWPFCIYFLFQKNIKFSISIFISLLALIALIDTFIFSGDYGYLTTTFRFSNPDTFESKYRIIILSILVSIAIMGIFLYLLLSRHKFIFHSVQLIALISLLAFGFLNLFKINADFNEYAQRSRLEDKNDAFLPVYNFSKEGKNVLVIMLDEAISGYLPYILEEKPELLEIYRGFTYFPNTISFGSHTRIGAPPIFGGYEYEPKYIQNSRRTAMLKHNEALLVMPRLFSEAGYKVSVTDPSFANYSLKPDLSIYKPYPDIKAYNTIGAYSGTWFKEHPEVQIVSISSLMESHLIRFSILKMAPPAFRIFLYDRGDWLKESGNSKNELSIDTVDNYTTLDYLTKLTKISGDNTNNFIAMVNELPHYQVLLQYPDYTPGVKITEIGKGPFAHESHYHVNMAAMLLLGKWFSFLQNEAVWDNTRIIIVSDHGRGLLSKYPGNIILPNGNCLQSYNSLLLFKDFYSEQLLKIDNTFMTIADVPLLTLDNIISNPKNPFSGKRLGTDKDKGVYIATSTHLYYTIEENQWMHVKDNIFDAGKWKIAGDPRK
jgi:YidC/Oxa1 family membrane protein insertase